MVEAVVRVVSVSPSACTSPRGIPDRAYGTLSIWPSEAFMNNSG
jgi:hypothetical protein